MKSNRTHRLAWSAEVPGTIAGLSLRQIKTLGLDPASAQKMLAIEEADRARKTVIAYLRRVADA